MAMMGDGAHRCFPAALVPQHGGRAELPPDSFVRQANTVYRSRCPKPGIVSGNGCARLLTDLVYRANHHHRDEQHGDEEECCCGFHDVPIWLIDALPSVLIATQGGGRPGLTRPNHQHRRESTSYMAALVVGCDGVCPYGL